MTYPLLLMVETTNHIVTAQKKLIVKFPAIIMMIIKNSDNHTLVLFNLNDIFKLPWENYQLSLEYES